MCISIFKNTRMLKKNSAHLNIHYMILYYIWLYQNQIVIIFFIFYFSHFYFYNNFFLVFISSSGGVIFSWLSLSFFFSLSLSQHFDALTACLSASSSTSHVSLSRMNCKCALISAHSAPVVSCIRWLVISCLNVRVISSLSLCLFLAPY